MPVLFVTAANAAVNVGRSLSAREAIHFPSSLIVEEHSAYLRYPSLKENVNISNCNCWGAMNGVAVKNPFEISNFQEKSSLCKVNQSWFLYMYLFTHLLRIHNSAWFVSWIHGILALPHDIHTQLLHLAFYFIQECILCAPASLRDRNRSRAWQIILKDLPIILFFYSQIFSPLFFQTSPLFFHILKQHHAASAKINCHDLCS